MRTVTFYETSHGMAQIERVKRRRTLKALRFACLDCLIERDRVKDAEKA